MTSALALPEEEKRALGRYGRQVVQEHYSVRRMAEDCLAVYDQVHRRRYHVVMSGYYGFSNAGDDAILQSIHEGILAASRDVLSMIEHYKQNSGPVFSAELDVLTADMRSGSYEAALTRFEARFNSPLLSDIVRGLIGVLRGDNGVHYFQMLSHDMKQLELQRLKAKAMKIPPKIRVFSFVLLMCFLVTYLSIIIYEIIHSLGGMF